MTLCVSVFPPCPLRLDLAAKQAPDLLVCMMKNDVICIRPIILYDYH